MGSNAALFLFPMMNVSGDKRREEDENKSQSRCDDECPLSNEAEEKKKKENQNNTGNAVTWGRFFVPEGFIACSWSTLAAGVEPAPRRWPYPSKHHLLFADRFQGYLRRFGHVG